MALFNDGPISPAADLQRVRERRFLTVASAESIDLAAKMSLAQEDLANEVVLFLLRRRVAARFCDDSAESSGRGTWRMWWSPIRCGSGTYIKHSRWYIETRTTIN